MQVKETLLDLNSSNAELHLQPVKQTGVMKSVVFSRKTLEHHRHVPLVWKTPYEVMHNVHDLMFAK